MDFSLTYCHVALSDPLHKPYHDTEYGFPIATDDGLFERLILEINQAGLSWATILKKREGFRLAYAGFSIAEVASFGPSDISRLLADPGIIRNRLKVEAAIENARRIRVIQRDHGSFQAWIDSHHPLPKPDWVRLFKKTFRFTGGEIVGEFLMSSGYLPGAHHPDCAVEKIVRRRKPAWLVRPLPE